jgi:hypothetical protein
MSDFVTLLQTWNFRKPLSVKHLTQALSASEYRDNAMKFNVCRLLASFILEPKNIISFIRNYSQSPHPHPLNRVSLYQLTGLLFGGTLFPRRNLVDSMEILQAVTKSKNIICGSSYRTETFSLTTSISTDRRLWGIFYLEYGQMKTSKHSVKYMSHLLTR